MTPSANERPPVTVEVVVDSVDGARAAATAGADRLELCSAPALGGLTPSLGLLRHVLAAVQLPVVAMLRPRAGDFLYAPDEFAVLRADLEELAAAGAHGFAAGVLTADGDVDRAHMRELVQAAGPLPVTCHRAFDVARDPASALAQLADLGVARVLTSGQRRTAALGADCIRDLVGRAQGRIAVMAGAGVRAANVAALVAATGVREVHLSASRFEPAGMRHHNPDVAMATVAADDERQVRRTDGDEIAAVRAALRGG
ncbi:MAG: copper homeostasis protein CutC [Planctomycetota bacterium]